MNLSPQEEFALKLRERQVAALENIARHLETLVQAVRPAVTAPNYYAPPAIRIADAGPV